MDDECKIEWSDNKKPRRKIYSFESKTFTGCFVLVLCWIVLWVLV